MLRRITPSAPFAATALCCAVSVTAVSHAEATDDRRGYNLPAGEATSTLNDFARASGQQIVFMMEKVKGVRTNAIKGEYLALEALDRMLDGTGLRAARDQVTGAFVVSRRQADSAEKVQPHSDPSKSRAASSPPPSSDTQHKNIDQTPVKKTKFLSKIASAFLAVFASASVSAQNTPAQAAPPASDEVVTMDPFTVVTTEDHGYLATNSASATRINALIQDTPMTVSVVTRDQIDDIGSTDLSTALNYTAGVTPGSGAVLATHASGDANFQLHGLTASVYRDGFSALGIVDNADIERVEVIDGPASVFYGNVLPGGIINVVTKQPGPNPGGYVRLTYDEYGMEHGELDYNQPLSSDNSLLGRFNMSQSSGRTFRRFSGTSNEFYAPSVSWQPFKKLKITEDVEILHMDGGLINIAPEQNVQGTTILYDPLYICSKDFNMEGPNTIERRNKYTSTTLADFTITHDLTGRLSFNGWTIKEAGQAIAMLGYNQPAYPGLVWFCPNLTEIHETQWAARDDWSWKVKTGPVTNQVILGGERSYDDTYEIQMINQTTTRYIDPTQFDQYPDSEFSFPDYPGLVNGWKINSPFPTHGVTVLDAAYLSDVITAFDGKINMLIGDRWNRITITNRLNNASSTTSAYSPQIGGLVKATDGLGVFASYSTSVTPNGLATNNVIYPPSMGYGEEGGLKFDVVNHRFVGTVSAFSVQQKEIVNPVFVTNPNGASIQSSSASGAQRTRGWDTEWVISATDNLQFTLSYANVNGVVNVGSAGSTPTAVSPTQGLPTNGSAKNTAAALGKYEFKAGQLKGLMFGVGISYHDRFRDKAVSEGAAKYAVDYSPAAGVVEAFAGYHFKAFKRQMNFTIRGQNVTDRRYEDIETSSPTIAPPFTLSGTLEVKF